MSDILPKNPYHRYDFDGKIVEPVEWEYWQQGQDETMKVLRPILEGCQEVATALVNRNFRDNLWEDDERAYGIIKQLEQILKESE